MALQTTFDQCNYIYTSVIYIWLVQALKPVAGDPKFWASYKTFNVTEDKSQPPPNIIECSNAEKFGCDNYLAIFVLK